MTRFPITKHGGDHRLPGTIDADDPGGHDPVPIRFVNKLPMIAVEAPQITSLADSTNLTLDFTSGTVKTNDGAYAITGSGPTSPFTGTYFSFNWGTNTHNVNIIHAGFYLVHRYFQIYSFSSAFGAGQQWFGLIAQGGGGWALGNDSNNMDRVVAAQGSGGGTQFETAWKTENEGLVVAPNATPIAQTMVVQQRGSGLTISSAYAGLAIIRLGDIA